MPSNLPKKTKELFSAVEAGGEERTTQAYMTIRRGVRDEANERILPKATPTIAVARCSGCGRCVAACPERIITLEANGHRKQAVITAPERCTRCGACITACPLEAIAQPPFPP